MELPHVTVRNRFEWRKWLRKNFHLSTGIWLIYFKDGSGIEYEESVEVALCFGWIDSTIKRIDDSTYVRKFTPRRRGSRWSAPNKSRVRKMIAQRKMTKAGLDALGDALDECASDENVPADLKAALQSRKGVYDNFFSFAPGYRRVYIRWVNDAKKAGTRSKRIRTVVLRAANRIKPTMENPL